MAKEQKVSKNNLKKEISVFIVNWNNRWPIDYWWRKKYNVPFGSEKHRQANFIQMYLDYEEEKMMKKLYSKDSEKESERNFDEEFKKTGTGETMSQSEIDDSFDNIDLSSYNIKEKDKK